VGEEGMKMWADAWMCRRNVDGRRECIKVWVDKGEGRRGWTNKQVGRSKWGGRKTNE
jgi:hypothetical protein